MPHLISYLWSYTEIMENNCNDDKKKLHWHSLFIPLFLRPQSSHKFCLIQKERWMCFLKTWLLVPEIPHYAQFPFGLLSSSAHFRYLHFNIIPLVKNHTNEVMSFWMLHPCACHLWTVVIVALQAFHWDTLWERNSGKKKLQWLKI